MNAHTRVSIGLTELTWTVYSLIAVALFVRANSLPNAALALGSAVVVVVMGVLWRAGSSRRFPGSGASETRVPVGPAQAALLLLVAYATCSLFSAGSDLATDVVAGYLLLAVLAYGRGIMRSDRELAIAEDAQIPRSALPVRPSAPITVRAGVGTTWLMRGVVAIDLALTPLALWALEEELSRARVRLGAPADRDSTFATPSVASAWSWIPAS